MNAFTNMETIKRAQELLEAMSIEQNQSNAMSSAQNLPQGQQIQQSVWYKHYPCNYGDIAIPQNITISDRMIDAISILLDAYGCVYTCRIDLQLQGYTDDNNMRLISTNLDILFIIENGKINIIRN